MTRKMYLLGAGLAVLLIALAVTLLIRTRQAAPTEVWLPKATSYSDDQQANFRLLVKTDTSRTEYGTARRFISTDQTLEGDHQNPITTVYEFRANARLQPGKCPNITHIESVLPSDCSAIGTVQGQPIYGINRRLSSSAGEYFVQLDGTFIYVKSAVDGQLDASYLRQFQKRSLAQVATDVAANQQALQKIVSGYRANAAATKLKDQQAYTKLDFTPAMPQTLPPGWKLSNGAEDPVYIDGPDNEHPKLVHLNYQNDKNQFVEVYVGKLSDYKLEHTCGPTPGQGMQHLACIPSADSDFYEAAQTLEDGAIARSLYFPVGDSLVISNILAPADNGKPAVWPTELANLQNQIVLSSKPVSKDTLKGHAFHSLQY